MKKRSFANGGATLADDEGNTPAELEKKGRTWRTLTRQSETERHGRQVGEQKYSRAKRLDASLGQPGRALNKGARWAMEQLGDAAATVRGMASGNPEPGEIRKGMKARREAHLGYAKGGKVKKRSFANGGDVPSRKYSAKAEEWLGGADRTDPHIISRMKSAVSDWDTQAPAPVEERRVEKHRVGASKGRAPRDYGDEFQGRTGRASAPAPAPAGRKQSFRSAFAAARLEGKSQFPWNGDVFTTELEKVKKPSTREPKKILDYGDESARMLGRAPAPKVAKATPMDEFEGYAEREEGMNDSDVGIWLARDEAGDALGQPRYAKGGKVKKQKSPGKKEIIRALMAAHQAGIQKGAMAAGPKPGMPPPGGGGGVPPGVAGLPPGGPAGGPPPTGMKKGGFVPFAKKGAGKPGDKKEKWTPPWLKKGKKFAAGGRVGGGRGDGCAVRGRTRGRMV